MVFIHRKFNGRVCAVGNQEKEVQTLKDGMAINAN